MSATKSERLLPAMTWEQAVDWLRDQPEYRQAVLDSYYDQPVLAAAERFQRSEEWLATRALLPVSGAAVEIGAGSGISSMAMASAGLSVVAIEPDASDRVGRGAIRKLAIDCGHVIDVRDGTIECIPAQNAEFDVVFARQVLHPSRDLRLACREIHRVLKPGGILVATRDHVISSPEQLPHFLRSHPLHALYGGENAFMEREYSGAIAAAGLAVEKTIRSFDSVINFAPHTREQLRELLLQRIARVPLLSVLVAGLMRTDFGFDLVLKLLAIVDNRPGRLVSFVARKPLTE
jgi:SAM-dependent methyltransferase